MAKDGGVAVVPEQDPARLVVLRAEWKAAEDKVATLTEALSLATVHARAYAEQLAPELLREMELEEYTFQDGVRLAVGQKVHVSIRKQDQQSAMGWLIKEGHGAMVQTRITIDCGRGAHAEAEALEDYCAQLFPEYAVQVTYAPGTELSLVEAVSGFLRAGFQSASAEKEEWVHPSTLRAFVRKQLAAGASLPAYFGIFAPRVATLTPPKHEAERPAF